jgi:hypothetical protein
LKVGYFLAVRPSWPHAAANRPENPLLAGLALIQHQIETIERPVWSVWSKRRRPARMRWFAVRLAGLTAGAGRAGALVEVANVSERVTPAQLLGYLARTDQGRSQPLAGCTAV